MGTIYTKFYGLYATSITVQDTSKNDNVHISIDGTSGAIFIDRHGAKQLRRALKAWLRDTK